MLSRPIFEYEYKNAILSPHLVDKLLGIAMHGSKYFCVICGAHEKFHLTLSSVKTVQYLPLKNAWGIDVAVANSCCVCNRAYIK